MDSKKLRKKYMPLVSKLNNALKYVQSQFSDLPPSEFQLESNIKPYASVKRKMEADQVHEPIELSDLVRGRLFFSSQFTSPEVIDIVKHLFGDKVVDVDKKPQKSKEHGLEYHGVTHVDMNIDGIRFELQVMPLEFRPHKAAGELIVKAAHETHNLKYNITRCCNNYGPSQPPRNLIPRAIFSIINGKPIPIHGNGKQFREWIYVDDHCSAIMKIIEGGELNHTYNIGSGVEYTNITMVQKIAKLIGEPSAIVNFIKDRPGHDFRYSVDCSKIKKLGWDVSSSFEDNLEKCVKWYLCNPWYFDSVNL